MPPKRKKRKTALTQTTARSLDDDDAFPSSTSASSSSSSSCSPSSSSSSSSASSVGLRIDLEKSDLCRRFLALSQAIRQLSEGRLTPFQGSSDFFDVRLTACDGKQSGSASCPSGQSGKGAVSAIEIAHTAEHCRELKRLTQTARQDIQNEIAKRRQDIEALDADVQNLLAKIEPGGEDAEALGLQIVKMQVAKGGHKKRIRELEALEEVEVGVEVERHIHVVNIVSRVEASVQKEARHVPVRDFCIYVLGGATRLDAGELRSVQRFDSETNVWEAVADNTTERDACAAVVLGNALYVLGGEDAHGSNLASVEKYIPHTGSWSLVAPMLTARLELAACVLDGYIYAIGGVNEKVLATAERYNSTSDRWETVASMHTARKSCACAVSAGKVVVVGGFDGDCYLKSAERYDASRNQWEELAAMHKPRHGCVAVELDGYIYVAGGLNDDNPEQEDRVIATVERYDAKLNRWTHLADMTCPRYLAAAAVLNGQLHVLGGGQGKDGLVTASVERYNAQNNTWELVNMDMITPRWSHAAVRAMKWPLAKRTDKQSSSK
eukprot:g19978.t1